MGGFSAASAAERCAVGIHASPSSPASRPRSQQPAPTVHTRSPRFRLAAAAPLAASRRSLLVPRAVAASTDRASPELVGRFNLESNSELQITLNPAPQGAAAEINLEATNTSGSLILHWGALRPDRRDWLLPSRRPDGTTVYNNQALRTPFVKSGDNSTLRIEIDDPAVQAIEFLLFDEARNKWFKNNGQNFLIQLQTSSRNQGQEGASGANVVPEELVQIQSYLRWERGGKQSYTPDQEKVEYEAARAELTEELNRGVPLEKLRVRLTKTPESSERNIPASQSTTTKVPEELVQVQAYIRWEKAGKPNYSPEKQLVEFEEARKELQAELDKGTSIDQLRKKILKGNVEKKVSKQLENKKYFSVERIQRRNRDITQLLNKHKPVATEQQVKAAPKQQTVLDLFTKSLQEGNDCDVLSRKLFKIGDKEILAIATKALGKTRVHVATNDVESLILHWALAKKAGEWEAPTSSIVPSGSTVLDKACETSFVESELDGLQYQVVEIELDDDGYKGMPFVLRRGETWIKNNDSDFYLDFKTKVIKKDTGDAGKGTAKDFLERIADLEEDAQRSFMHRFNIAADLLDQARDTGLLGIVGLFVWIRFMSTRQLIWNKNYNVKPREISKAQDRFTDDLENMYKSYPQYREILRMILSAVGRGGEGDVGQRIRDEILVIQRNNDCKGGIMEEWHQKLHNNTSPDDVVICQAIIDYIKSDFDISVYWDTLNSNGITKQRLLSYDRAIHSEPKFRSDQKEGLLRDLGNYMRSLKAVHSGADLESAIATCMGYKSEGEGFMVGVQINPVKGLSSGFPELLQFVLDHVEDKSAEPLLEGLLEARVELRPLLIESSERLKDLIFLDIALDSTFRTAVERSYEELNDAAPEKIMYFIGLVLENLALSTDDNEDILYCLKGWNQAMEMVKQKDDQWALYAKAFFECSHFCCQVGAKSRNIAYLKGKVPSWVGIPTSVAIPFGTFEKVLSDDTNKEVAQNIQMLKGRLAQDDFSALGEMRKTVLDLTAPAQLVKELKEKMLSSGMPWPGDESDQRWEQAWMAIKKVWASKWNERAYFSTRKVKLDHDYLSMAVLVQEIVNADYAFVIHTTNPSSGDSSEIYAEVVKGLGETLVGAYPGRAMSFVCKKDDLDCPKVLGYPSKPIGLFIKRSIIFRSDSNGEDLEGYAGAGLYDSVPMDEEDQVVLDYTTDALITDSGFRNSILSSIARAGHAIEELYGSPQDVEGVVKDGNIYVVQTRPQM
uniref:Uncharacterized protein n=1 Tax=Avena sativa TaxID=4498 RepID=A0ACD6AE84_AVESA